MATETAAATDLIARATVVGLSSADLLTSVGQRPITVAIGRYTIDELAADRLATCNRREIEQVEALIAKREAAANRAVQAVAPAGELMATEKQVAMIQRLRVERVRTGEGGGFVTYTGDPSMLTRLQASQLIDSLRGEY